MNTIKQLSLQPLFYSPLIIFELANAKALNKSLLQEIAQLKSQDAGLVRSNHNGWHSQDDLFNRPEPAFKQLCTHIMESIGAATRTIAPTFDFAAHGVQMQGWVNVLGKDGMNTPHDHAGWSWSGTYYVAVPPSSQTMASYIEFLDSRTNIANMLVERAPCFDQKYMFKPEAGLLIVFPSYLKHWVYPNDSEEERVSVAFNARFVKNGS